MNKQFAIFDMDGTLVDSMVYWQRLGKEYLKSKGITCIPDHILERIIPMTMTESSALFIHEFNLPGTIESVAAEMNEIMDAHYRKDIPLKPGVREYLKKLKQEGVIMCVASTTKEELMDACLRRLNVLDLFDFLLSCESVGAGKSKPDVYHAAASKLGAKPKDIAVYEDALYAVKTAKAAGYYVLGVYDDSSFIYWDEITKIADETIYDWKLIGCRA